MCGIAGIISNKRNIANDLDLIAKDLFHRGPDNTSFFVKNNIGLLHTRLSIIDLSKNGNQPLKDESNRYVITYNGELYNFLELKENLIKKGYIFKTKTDTEVVLNGFIEDGYSFFNKINGFYSICIYDTVKKELILTRDPCGKKPLYYSLINNELFFASEIKPILRLHKTIPLANYEGLSHYLWKGYYIDKNSAYSGIFSLLPGEIIKVSADKDTIKVISDGQSNQVKLAINDNYDLRNIEDIYFELTKSIENRLISDVPISFLLSGGIDSSLISQAASELIGKNISTNYLGFKNEDPEFSNYADIVSNKINSKHKKIIMEDLNVEDAANKMISIFGEPFADYSALPSYELYKSVSKESKVVIGGDGADEIFGGYKDIKVFLLKKIIDKFLYKGKNDDLLGYIYELVNSPLKYKRYFGFSIGAVFLSEKKFSHITSRGGWNCHYRKKYMTDYGYNLTGRDLTEINEENIFIKSGNNITERYFNYYIRRMIFDFNVKVDRTSMANSVEVRSPFQDRNMINKINYFSSKGMVNLFNTKKELKKILMNKGLGNITKSKKQGFTPPLKDWVVNRGGRVLINNILDEKDSIVCKIFNTNKLKESLKTKQDIENNFSRIWHLMLLHTWEKKNYH